MPHELKTELKTRGLRHEDTLTIEGAAVVAADLDARIGDPVERAILPDLIRGMEQDPLALGMSAYMVAIRRKPTDIIVA